jgi:hypothetical protein
LLDAARCEAITFGLGNQGGDYASKSQQLGLAVSVSMRLLCGLSFSVHQYGLI